MAATVAYDNLCPIGRQRQAEVTSETTALRSRVRAAQNPRAPLGAEQSVIDQQAHLDTVRIELSRHVAHCNDGCQRLSDPNAVFADPQYQRGPTHQLPDVPNPAELAELLRGGHDIEDLADTYGRHVGTLRQHLSRAGFSSATGEPNKAKTNIPPVVDPNGYANWMADGLCAQTDPEVFFPDKGGSTREAKAVCASCGVAAECLDYALVNEERFGIWGGLSERERRAITRRLETNFPTDQTDTQETA